MAPRGGAGEKGEDLLKRVLSWSFPTVLERGGQPPWSAVPGDLKPVPAAGFPSLYDYVQTFRPLLLHEVAAQLEKGWGEHKADAFEARVYRKEERVTPVGACVSVSVIYTARADREDRTKDDDIVFVTTRQPQVARKANGSDRVLDDTHALATVERDREGHLTLLMLNEDAEPDEEGGREGGQGKGKGDRSFIARMNRAVVERGTVCITRLSSMRTLTREWRAANGLMTLPYKDSILQGLGGKGGGPGATAHRKRFVPKPLDYELNRRLNRSQVDAAEAGLFARPVTLIQGPPGTGKTHTILGLLGVLLGSKPLSKDVARQAECREKLERVGYEPDARRLRNLACPWLVGNGIEARLERRAKGEPAGPPPPKLIKTKLRRITLRPRRVLVCAPSNAAVDELMERILKQGILDGDGRSFKPPIVRAGRKEAISSAVLGVSMAQKLQQLTSSVGWKGEDMEVRAKQTILDQAVIVGATLAVSGSDLFVNNKTHFDAVIIDEATQAVEPSTLVPLVHNPKCRQVFLVGDPQQLPATVISKVAAHKNFDQSLFRRLQNNGHPVVLLDTQYRMHPEIRKFPSKSFYGDQLQDSFDVGDQTKKPWHEYPIFGPFAFIDVASKERRGEGDSSFSNDCEADVAVFMVKELLRRYEAQITGSPLTVGVISPYKAQVAVLKEKFRAADLLPPAGGEKKLPSGGSVEMEISTIDGFQGREKDVMLFSTVRAPSNQIGFVRDERRMNVGMTRARSTLLVVGHAPTLRQNDWWKDLVQDAEDRQVFFSGFGVDGSAEDWLKVVAENTKQRRAVDDQDDWVPMADPQGDMRNLLSGSGLRRSTPKKKKPKAPGSGRLAAHKTANKGNKGAGQRSGKRARRG